MKLLKAETVAGILDISTARVYEIIRTGILPAVKLGRQVRIEEQTLEAWIKAGGQGLPGGWRWESDEDDVTSFGFHPDDSDEIPF